MSADTRRFLTRLFIALLPPLVYVAIFTGAPMWVGELSSLADVVRAQQQGKVRLFGRAYSDHVFAYKQRYLERQRARIVAIGSSRILELKFPGEDAGCFYNAGSVAQYSTEATAFLKSLPTNSLPAVVILAMDHHWFNASADSRRPFGTPDRTVTEDRPGLYRGLNVSRLFLSDVLTGKIRWTMVARRQDPISHQRAMGLNAVINGNGFLPDGSYQYGTAHNKPIPVERRVSDAMASYRGAEAQFLRGTVLSQKGMRDLTEFISVAHSRGVRVIGILPPFMPTVYAALAADSRYGYLRGLPEAVQSLFEQNGELFLDFSNPALIGGADSSMYDGIHATPSLMSRIRDDLLARSPELAGSIRSCGMSKTFASSGFLSGMK